MPIRAIADPFAQQLGARIRDLRLEQGKSLDAMQSACGVSKGHLSSIERGYVLMNVGTLLTTDGGGAEGEETLPEAAGEVPPVAELPEETETVF